MNKNHHKGLTLRLFLRSILLFITIFHSAAHADVNVRTNIFKDLLGINANIDIPVSQKWTVGPGLSFYRFSDTGFDVKGYEISARGNYWFSGDVFSQGWYLGPTISLLNIKVEHESVFGGTYEGEANVLSTTVFAGYQWMWESFNIMLGLGPSYYASNKITIKDNQGNTKEFGGFSGSGLSLEFTLGWKF